MQLSKITAVRVQQVRGQYVSARAILQNLASRGIRAGASSSPVWADAQRSAWHTAWPLLRAAEVEFIDGGGQLHTITVRDCDVRFLRDGRLEKVLQHLNHILSARSGDAASSQTLKEIQSMLHTSLDQRFDRLTLVDTEVVVPHTTTKDLTASDVSDKGHTFLDLARRGMSFPDICFLTAQGQSLSPEAREAAALQALCDLEQLSGRRFADPEDPLLVAVRAAMPNYIPGIMPTFLNVGITEALMPALIGRYGEHAAYRMAVNGWGYILEAIAPERYATVEPDVHPKMDTSTAQRAAEQLALLIKECDPRLISDPAYQLLFFIAGAYNFYEANSDMLATFSAGIPESPTVILQRMICTVKKGSRSGLLYSRNPITGRGFLFEYDEEIFGDEIMTGIKTARQSWPFTDPEEIKDLSPGIYHFLPTLRQMEKDRGSPVMVECHDDGIFTLFQVNVAELTGPAMLTAAMSLLQEGTISPEQVLRLVKPYHIRQIEGPAIDRDSLESLSVFCRAASLLPRSAVSGRVYFSFEAARTARERGERVILAKPEFQPADAALMEKVDGILCGAAAALHVTTSCRNRGIPGLVNLERAGITIDPVAKVIRQQAAACEILEGDMVTISSRRHELLLGEAHFIPARLLRHMRGEEVDFSGPAEQQRFEQLARDYRELQRLMRAAKYKTLGSAGSATRYGELSRKPDEARELVNACFEANAGNFVEALFNASTGEHLVNGIAFRQLTTDNQVRLLKAALTKSAREGRVGIDAGSFVIGSFSYSQRETPVAFWEGFTPLEVAMLINEWIHHERYSYWLSFYGDRKPRLAIQHIKENGVGNMVVHDGTANGLLPLKLSSVDLRAVRAQRPAGQHRQFTQIIDLLLRPYSAFFDFGNSWSLKKLQDLCSSAGIPVPKPEDI
ncbi:MAG: hypothetical protein QME05_04675 [Candidatus Margulisbacteria bacterium]|nr:hypothetical protein [Candidatus Margulisiibacteriota bacterium]